MKRKLFTITLTLALLLSAYTAYACLSTRGLRIYLMDTRAGAILAGTWQFSLLAAIVLWIPGAVVLLRKVGGLRRSTAASTGPRMPVGDAAEKEAPDGADPLQPQRSADQKTEPLQPQRGADQKTELLQPRRGAGQESEALEPEKSGEEASSDMEGRPTQAPADPFREEESLQVCPNCGHPVAGKKFCAKCGTKVG